MSDKIKLVEVGPRDGLQNEKKIISTEDKIQFIQLLAETGLKNIEAGSFVAEKNIPQLADSDLIISSLNKNMGINFSGLVPNNKGLERAIAAGVNSIAIFSATTDSFCQHNINCTVTESFRRFEDLLPIAKEQNIPVRAYLSCCFSCPYEGKTKVHTVVNLAKKLIDLGCYEISIGDTTGVATPNQVNNLLQALKIEVKSNQIAVHFHDTYGQAIANIYTAINHEIKIIDSAVAGLGGCPYAKGATGNVATEDVLYLLDGLGFDTGVSMDKLLIASQFICNKLQITTNSKVAQALLN